MEPRRHAITPTVFYRDPIAALRWLEATFGFETTSLVTDAEGRVGYSEMRFGDAAVSVGGEWSGDQLGGAAMKSPASLNGAGTQFLWVDMPDGLDAHYERAKAAGARITDEPADQFYGARTYRALDPEGHVWNFRQHIREVDLADQEAATGLKFRNRLED